MDSGVPGCGHPFWSQVRPTGVRTERHRVDGPRSVLWGGTDGVFHGSYSPTVFPHPRTSGRHTSSTKKMAGEDSDLRRTLVLGADQIKTEESRVFSPTIFRSSNPSMTSSFTYILSHLGIHSSIHSLTYSLTVLLKDRDCPVPLLPPPTPFVDKVWSRLPRDPVGK